MKHILLLLFVFLFCCPRVARATHIVGGEFELRYESGNRYRLTLNLYNDDINGDPLAIDDYIIVNIFEKKTNRFVREVILPSRSKSNVRYTNIDCTVGGLKTSKIVYYESITMSPSSYANPDGYYISWERCCRNETITNIIEPRDAAQTFYLEFPALLQNGSTFINSSPRLFPPLSDYACVNELFYFDFAGHDPDGDSLVYDMVTPLNGFTNPSMPAYGSRGYEHIRPQPADYPPVQWQPGYGTTTQILGNPPINIDRKTGRLTMRPNQTGLFVFGVRVQEFRNNKKIGEVRRDFQVLVLDCPTNQTPEVMARKKKDKAFYQAGEVLEIVSDGSRCIDVYFTDPDISEFVLLKVQPVNFTNKDYELEGIFRGIINQGTTQDSLKATLCFDDCFDTNGEVYQLDLIVQDDGCSLPRLDTLRVSFIAEPKIINYTPTLTSDKAPILYELDLYEPFEAHFNAEDLNLDPLTLKAIGDGFSIEDLGMSFTATPGNGIANGVFKLNANCLMALRGVVKVDFIVEEQNCNPDQPPVISMEFKIRVPQLQEYIPPNIFTPNGDGLNDYFEIPGLPAEFCTAQFRNIKVFNRWGVEVYNSSETNFKWPGNGVTEGVYFYVIDFGSRQVKGNVTLVR